MNVLLETGITGNMDGNCQNDDCNNAFLSKFEFMKVIWFSDDL